MHVCIPDDPDSNDVDDSVRINQDAKECHAYIVCAVCGDGGTCDGEAGTKDDIVFCDSCNIPVHIFCYGQVVKAGGSDPIDGGKGAKFKMRRVHLQALVVLILPS